MFWGGGGGGEALVQYDPLSVGNECICCPDKPGIWRRKSFIHGDEEKTLV